VVCGEALMEDFLSDNVGDVHKIDVGAIVKFENFKIEGLKAKHGPLPVKLLAGLIDIKNEIAQGAHGGKKVFLGPVKIIESIENMQVYSRGTVKLFFGLIKLEKENIDFARGSIAFKITIGDKSVVNLGDTVFQEEWEGLKPDVNCDFLWKRKFNPADDEMFKREVERMGIACHIMQYGDKIVF